MAEYTQNYNLKKPAEEDFYNVEDFNDNADIIDQALKSHDDALAAHEAENASKHITESGSNENGSYIKFDDGTMICYNTNLSLTDISITIAKGNVYYSNDALQWVYPVAFVSYPAVSCFVRYTSNLTLLWIGQYAAPADNQQTYSCFRVISATSEASINGVCLKMIATGRWKA